MPAEHEYLQLTQFFRALSDKSRLQIVGRLLKRDMCVEELATELRKSPATVSHHLKKLAEAGLVEAYARQHYHFYKIRLDELNRFSKELFALQAPTPAQTFEGYSEYEAKVLKDFFEDDRLTTIPSQRKKRLVILKYILAAFEAGKRYSEKDVNECIRAFHDDCATIRREFIMNKMMDRKAGYYWRID